MGVTYELHGSVAALTLDDGKANAINHDVLAGLHEGLDRSEKEATAVLISGRPGRFSAGFDLSVMTSGEEQMRGLVRAGAELLLHVFEHPQPVVAACTGHALAAGALLLFVCDQRIGAQGDFKIGLNEVAIGMPLPIFAIEFARYRMPPSAFDTALLGQVFPPEQARAAGYLDRVVPSDTLLTEAGTTAAQLASLRTGAVQRSKELAREAVVAHIRATLDDNMANLTGPA